MIILSNFMKSLLDKRNEYQSDVLYKLCLGGLFGTTGIENRIIESAPPPAKTVFCRCDRLASSGFSKKPDFPHIAKNNGTALEQDLWACGSVDTPPRRNHSI